MNHRLITTATLLFLAVLFARHITPALASPVVTPTKSAKTTPVVTPTILPTPSQSIDPKIDEIRNTIKEKVNEIKDKAEKKAYVGTISQITDNLLSLVTKKGFRQATITDETIIIGTTKKELKVLDLKPKDRVIAMGGVSPDGVVEAKRIVVLPNTTAAYVQRNSVWITDVSINTKKKLITGKVNNRDKEFYYDSTTLISDPRNPSKTIKYTDLDISNKLIAIFVEKNKAFYLKSVFLIN